MADTVRDNMKYWRALERTDKDYTKEVGYGRKFTTINAQWQLMRMTEVFGPVGQGWGYDVVHDILVLNEKLTVAIADVTVWWSNDDSMVKRAYGPVRGCTELYYEGKGGKMLLDDDGPKKAMTDALTKALSHVGVSADIFLGKYEDNKYVERITRELAAEKLDSSALPAALKLALTQLGEARDLAELNDFVAQARAAAVHWDQIHRDLYAIRARERRIAMGGSVPAE